MARFLLAHAVEESGGGGEVLAQAVGKVGVDFLILFFQRDGQREDFTLGETVETTHTPIASQAVRARIKPGWLSRISPSSSLRRRCNQRCRIRRRPPRPTVRAR